jgi:tetratricopeptide (TPR) repeat protein
MNFNNITDKSKLQLENAEKRLSEISLKLSKVAINAGTKNSINQNDWDWTKSYSSWSQFEDAEELKQLKDKEEEKIQNILASNNPLGHAHDHSKERAFFESSEEFKFQACERNRLMGNYHYSEGNLYKAAEFYQLTIVYYEYCFPEDVVRQEELTRLKHTCLCNISLCYNRLSLFRKAIEAVTQVVDETNGTHVKALYRRAQSYRQLDEYEFFLFILAFISTSTIFIFYNISIIFIY